jgi:signal transduction histidine kinase
MATILSFVAISDTGIVITPEYKERLFEPLFTTKVRWIGLGLVITKNLIEANNG